MKVEVAGMLLPCAWLRRNSPAATQVQLLLTPKGVRAVVVHRQRSAEAKDMDRFC